MGDTEEKPFSDWEVNPVQRILRMINGLQERSKRSLTLVSTVFGGLSVFRLLQLALDADVESQSLFLDFVLSTAAIFMVISVILFAISMRQISVVEKGSVPQRSVEEWRSFLVEKLSIMERRHHCAGVAFVGSCVTVVIYFVARLCVAA